MTKAERMKFDKSKVYTALNVEELKVGSKAIVGDNLFHLKESVSKHSLPKTIKKIESEEFEHRFLCDDGFHYAFAYLVEEPKEKPLLHAGTRIKFSNGDIATILKFNCDNMHFYHLMFGDKRIESIDLVNMKSIDFLDLRPITLLIDTTWEIIE